MPAITSLGIATASPAIKALSALAGRIGQGLKEFADRMKNRRDSFRLADLDDRMLADIGLHRSDLRDAYAGPLWRDPSELLARRAIERRARHGRVATSQHQAVLFRARLTLSYPAAKRSGRHLV
ncbi:DUF1127 domain-containing protein [Rhodoplanes sp. Z2-YC6860]|uniref:DUF1127 domain-containing protein n=1 Tax=Rhodoplanes sp. Z2-YC6860 TaxID=674703 RepID=UPI00078E60EA|nr:DUF1127 domain-containing protein [Rhodoplanes sp. Z2-YC6860]AMN44814.1 hypothetical protein RHPLAN_64080 [Rhodoplanes sp. Z2-YC6860]